jgi:hypothetical protein
VVKKQKFVICAVFSLVAVVAGNAVQKESVTLDGKTYVLLANETYSCVTEKGTAQCISGHFPIAQVYGAGGAMINLTNKDRLLSVTYEWNSAMTGGAYEILLGNTGCVNAVNAFFNGTNSQYSEKIDLANQVFTRSNNQIAVCTGPVLIAFPENSNGSGFEKFIVTYGGKMRNGDGDFSAKCSLNWSDKVLRIAFIVTDDVFVPGEGINADHVEIWWNDAAWADGLIIKPTGLTKQILVNFPTANTVKALYGYPSNGGELPQVKGTCKSLEKGYEVTLELPSNLFPNHESLIDGSKRAVFQDGDVLCLALILSDADEKRKQETMMATSPVKWGNPSTFGRVTLVKDKNGPIASENLYIR